VIGGYNIPSFSENLPGASMDFTSLAKELTRYLLPFLPFLWDMSKGAAEQATQGAVQKFGADAWDRAKELWKPLKAKSETHPSLKEAVADVVEELVDKDRRKTLRSQLQELFEQDRAFAQEVVRLLGETKSEEARAKSTLGNTTVIISSKVGSVKGNSSNIFY
jgi:formate dehydrogenase maturation protein FdhE